jgi:Uma2 family endonuclease
MVKVQETVPSYGVCPPLQNGDHLDAAEFMRRYGAMEARGEDIKAELLDGIVYITYPIGYLSHGIANAALQMWLGRYSAYAESARHATNATVKLGRKDIPMPDGMLWDSSAKNAWLTDDDYLEGAPELVAETSASSASYDLHQKLKAYQKAGVSEYIVWRTRDDQIDWFLLEDGAYTKTVPDKDGIIRSSHFPGLWLNVPALLTKNRREVLRTLDEGLAAQGFR